MTWGSTHFRKPPYGGMAHEPFGWNCDVGDVERASIGT